MIPFPKKKYKIIYADPPWSFDNWGYEDSPKGAEKHYRTMNDNDIKKIPIDNISEENSVLFLWGVSPRLPSAFEVMKAWGFDYKTIAFVWVKKNKTTSGYAFGTGYYTRANCEYCLLGIKGKPLPKLDLSIRQVCDKPRLNHSQKPDEFYAFVEAYAPAPRYAELFQRTSRSGWDGHGDEVKNAA